MPRVLLIHRYVFRELLGPFLLSLAVATFVLLLAKIMELTDLVVTRGVGLEVVGRLLLYTLPYFFVFAVPMATLLGVLLGFMRLSSDNEITALKAAGVSLGRLVWPVVLLAFLTWGATQAMSIWALPWGHNQFENLVFDVGQKRADLVLKERTFIDSFPGLVIYINRLPGQGALQDVFIVDQRDPLRAHTVVAKRGRLFPIREGRITIRLYDGTVHAVAPDFQTAQNAKFDSYDVSIDAEGMVAARRTTKHRKEMGLAELVQALDHANPASREHALIDMELQQRFAYPFSCLIMAILGLPLGTHWRSGRSFGVIVALTIFLVYYLMLSLAWSLGDTAYYPPKLGVWLPNLLFGLFGAWLLRNEVRERPLPLLDGLGNLPLLLAQRRRGGQPS